MKNRTVINAFVFALKIQIALGLYIICCVNLYGSPLSYPDQKNESVITYKFNKANGDFTDRDYEQLSRVKSPYILYFEGNIDDQTLHLFKKLDNLCSLSLKNGNDEDIIQISKY